MLFNKKKKLKNIKIKNKKVYNDICRLIDTACYVTTDSYLTKEEKNTELEDKFHNMYLLMCCLDIDELESIKYDVQKEQKEFDEILGKIKNIGTLDNEEKNNIKRYIELSNTFEKVEKMLSYVIKGIKKEGESFNPFN